MVDVRRLPAAARAGLTAIEQRGAGKSGAALEKPAAR